VFTIKGRFKVKVGVCRGKKDYDKRESIKKRDTERDLRRKDF
jgi:SsrA-binding protein